MAMHRGHASSEEHDNLLITSWNKVVHKKDLTYILGDVTMETHEHYHMLDQLNGRKIVVLGNHDLPAHTVTLLQYVETVAGMVDWKGYVLTHAPIHPNEISFCRGNIHAHIHHENRLEQLYVQDRYGESGISIPTRQKYHNVDAHLIAYTPIRIEDLVLKATQPSFL